MPAIGIAAHLLRALRHAIRRVVMWFALSAAITAVVVELTSIVATGGHLPTSLTHLAALTLALAVGYAAALIVLLGEMMRGLMDIVENTEQAIHRERSGGTRLLGAVAHAMERPAP